MSDEVIAYLITVTPILIFKLVLIWAGVAVVRMGYELLLRGVSGDFKFQGGFHGVKADLVSASPGLLFAFLGVVLLAIGASVDKPFSMEMESANAGGSHMKGKGVTVPPPLPTNPPGIKEK